MTDLTLISRSGRETTVRGSWIEALKGLLRGDLILPADPGYDEARKVWNGMIDRRPGLIARCSGTADVISAVRFALERDLLVSVRGGGHSVAGACIADGVMMIDLSAMRGVQVDPVRRLATAQAGGTLGDLDHETQAFGLVAPAGIVTTTGIAGLTLGGGIGWTMRKYGLTCDNLVSADLVTAEGEFVRANGEENATLFWGLRGGGGNFGIVTSFEYQLHPLGPIILGGLLIYPQSIAPELLRFYRDFISTAPDELTTIAILRLAPPLPVIPEEIHGTPVVAIGVCYAGPIEEGERVIRPLREFAKPVADTVSPKPFTAHQSMLDTAQPKGRHYYWKSDDLSDLTDGAIDTLVEHGSRIASPSSLLAAFQLGGQVRRVDEDDTAYSHRAAAITVNMNASWDPPAEGAQHIGWASDFSAALQPYSAGVYVNFLGDEGQDRIRAAYSEGKFQRLVALKDQYDPRNFFRLNQNIEPSV